MRFPQLSGRRLDADTEARLAKLEREFKAITVEWDEWFDKYRRLYARLAKRVSDAQSDELPEPKGGVAPPPVGTYADHLKRVFDQMGHGGKG